MTSVLQYINQLSNLDPQIRIDSTQSILSVLKKAEGEMKNGQRSEVMKYVLNRIVKSLASSHDCAREGNLLCLITLLETFTSIQANEIIQIATVNFTISGNAHQNLRDVLFGKLCACLALIKAKRVEEKETVEWIFKTISVN